MKSKNALLERAIALATEEATRRGATHEDIRRLAKLVRQQTYEENDTGDGETLMVPPDDQ